MAKKCKGDSCVEEESLYEMIKSLYLESSLKEELLEKVKELNSTNSNLMYELHNSRIKIKKLKKLIFKLECDLYDI